MRLRYTDGRAVFLNRGHRRSCDDIDKIAIREAFLYGFKRRANMYHWILQCFGPLWNHWARLGWDAFGGARDSEVDAAVSAGIISDPRDIECTLEDAKELDGREWLRLEDD